MDIKKRKEKNQDDLTSAIQTKMQGRDTDEIKGEGHTKEAWCHTFFPSCRAATAARCGAVSTSTTPRPLTDEDDKDEMVVARCNRPGGTEYEEEEDSESGAMEENEEKLRSRLRLPLLIFAKESLLVSRERRR